MDIDLSELTKAEVYRLMIQMIVPRPVAWVLSENEDGGHNLAPFSYFAGITSDPPLVLLSIGRRPDGTRKDTWRNIEEREEFVIHLPPFDQRRNVTDSARPLPPGESELDGLGLALAAIEGFRLPRLRDLPLALACRRHRILELGNGPQGVVFGEIRRVWIDDRLVSSDSVAPLVDARALDPLARLGGDDYGRLGEIVTVPRPH